jgi:polygalacturonase
MVISAIMFLGFQSTLNITSFGASPNSGDDTAAIQKALDQARDHLGSKVIVPEGTFEASTLRIYAKTQLVGMGDGSVIKGLPQAQLSLINVNPAPEGTEDPNKNSADISISNLKLMDRVVEDGNRPHRHLINLNAASRVKIHDVLFSAYMGDAIYLGSGENGTERHNLDISITNNRFDGVNSQNRNAISIIDGTKILIDGNDFKRSSLKGPAMIDIEPNKHDFHWVQDITISNNTFADGRAAIKSDIFFPQEELKKPYLNLTIEGNKFKNFTDVGIQLYQQGEGNGSRTPNKFIIDNNQFANVKTGMRFRGLSGVQITNNTIDTSENGMIIGPAKNGCSDFLIKQNTFNNVGDSEDYPDGTAIVIKNADNVTVSNNRAVGLKRHGSSGPLVYLWEKGKTDGITVQNNSVQGTFGPAQALEASPTHKGGRRNVSGNSGG